LQSKLEKVLKLEKSCCFSLFAKKFLLIFISSCETENVRDDSKYSDKKNKIPGTNNKNK